MAEKLTACMIVRDEIDCLEACLDSIAPWVDEIAILDTGSIDGTWELVQLRAHQKAQTVWPEHFGKARNEALSLATGDWILIIDADERLVSGGDAMRQAIESPELLAAEIKLRNDMGDGTVGEFWAVRLFRRHPDLAYVGRIHEQIAGSVRALMSREPRWQTDRVGLVLAHDGYIPEAFEKKGKAQRNVHLLEIAVGELSETAPLHQRVYLEYKLSTALGAGPQGQACLLRAARRLIDAPAAKLLNVPLAAEILVSASQLWSRTGEGATALVAAERAQGCAAGHPMVSLVAAQALLQLGRDEDAAVALAGATVQGKGGFYFDPAGHAAAVAVASAEISHRRGMHGRALEVLSAAAAAQPENLALEIARLHSLIRAGQPEQALRAGLSLLKAHPGDRSGLLVCASAADAMGMTERAQRWRQMAMG